MKTLIVNIYIIACLVVFLFQITVSQKCNGGANCIVLDQCTKLYEQLKRGNSPELTQLLRGLHCGFENGKTPKICCPPEFLSLDETISTVPRFQSNSADPTTLLPNKQVCGIQNADRIVGGTRTDLDEHPWMALVEYDKLNGRGFYCGGVLINSRYVLTAAHCVKGADLPPSWKLSQVRLGEWNTSSERDCIGGDCSGPVQDIPIEQIIAHESYDPKDKDQQNDIALLRLTRHARFNDFVKPICLPLSNNLRRASYEGYDLEVGGWGKTESQETDSYQHFPAGTTGFTGSESDVKLKVRVPYVSTTQCADVYQRVNRQITDKQLCAGGDAGRDSCRGDSGGALMGQTPDATNWLVVGIVSYGPSPCGTEGWPGVYTRVGAYTDWILSNIRA